MDALGGYGSSSGDDSDAAPITAQHSTSKNALSGLLGDVSDASEDEDTPASPLVKKAKTADASSTPKQPPPNTVSLPEPRLAKEGDKNGTWYLSKVNYLKEPGPATSRLELDDLPTAEQIRENLAKIAATSNGQTYAEHIQSQPDFHNNLTPKDISEPLGSNIVIIPVASQRLVDYEKKTFPPLVTQVPTNEESS